MAMPFDQSLVCPVLIGRTSLLASFERLFEQARNGQGHTVLVSGEAGIGKSRLVAEARIHLGQEQVRFLQGICFEQDRALPFAPLLDALRSLLVTASRETFLPHLAPMASELIKILPDLAWWLPQVTPTPLLPPEQEKRRLFMALTSFLFGLADQCPLVLVLEDLHWSDDTSLEFLHGLTRHLRAHPLLLLLTYRREEVHPALAYFLSALDRERRALEFTLSPLSREEVQAMLRAIFQLKKPVRRDFLQALYEVTEGNPFFVEEILKSLQAGGDIFFTQGIWDRKPLASLHVPRSISDAVHQRICLLHEEARQTLELAAVAGRHVEFALLQALTGYSERDLVSCLDTLMAAQLLVESSAEQVSFRHALTRATIYTALSARKRKALHLMIAQTMERLYASSLPAHLADLAYHWYQAQAWMQALIYAQQVGERALALYAPRTALEHLTHALEAAEHLPEANRSSLFHARGLAHESLGHFEAARSDFEQALAAASTSLDRRGEWQSLTALGTLWTTRDYPHAGNFFRRALALAQELADPCLCARSQNRLATWSIMVGQMGVGISQYEQTLAVFRHHGQTADVAETLQHLALSASFSGQMRRSVAYYEQALSLFQELGDKRNVVACLSIRSSVMSPVFTEAIKSAGGTLAGCKQDLEEALRLAGEIEWRTGQAIAHTVAGWVLASFGQLGQGLAHSYRALELTSEIEHWSWMAGAYYGLGIVHLLLLDPKEAMVALEAGLSLARRQHSTFWIGNNTVALAQASLLVGNLPRAAALLEQARPWEQATCTIWERRLAWVWGELALAQHKPALALRQANTLLASAPLVEGKGEQGATEQAEEAIPALLKLRGEALCALGRLDEALLALEEARRSAQEREAHPHLWQIYRVLGSVYSRARQKQRAQQAWAASREIIAEMAASLTETERRERFWHAALASLPKEQRPLPTHQSTPHAVAELSERQREIALLIAQGNSSREIADALIISQRTVETHVGKIYAKVGCNSRAQLAAWVAEQGLLPSAR